MFLKTTPKWKMAIVRMFGDRIIDEHGRHVCWMLNGVPYFRIRRW